MVSGATDPERIVDWLAGMTDRFALRTFKELSLPRGF
jgi:dGTP triphosphohydrolase